MAGKRDHYEILGVARTATPEQIKKRYRLLVRRHHPDVAADKLLAKSAFIEISEAYHTLINPDRRVIYDSKLAADAPRVDAGRPERGGQTRQARRPTHSASPNAVAEARRMVSDAQVAFARGQFRDAELLCKQAHRTDHRNIKAYVILGDIYHIQGQDDAAAGEYTVAVQLDPKNREIADKLNRILRHQGRYTDAVAREERHAALKIGLSLIGLSVIGFMFVMLNASPGRPMEWPHPFTGLIGLWSKSLIFVLALGGAVAGFLLTVTENVEPLGEELVFSGVKAMGVRQHVYPIGLILVLFNVVSFYVAVGVYTVIALVQDSLSKSVYRSFAATFAVVLLAALAYEPGRAQVLVWGGNVAFPAVLFGWMIGDIFRPGF